MEPATAETHDTKEQLLRAGERLFAREGIHRVKLREINAMAGQRNPSALHYHFGTREGLVMAILGRHNVVIAEAMQQELDRLEAGERITIRDLAAAVVHPLSGKLDSSSGRAFLQILPQVVPAISASLRRGVMEPTTPQATRVLELLRERMTGIPETVLRERQVAYILMLTGALADRAFQLESGREMVLDRAQFEAHLLDMLEAALGAPSTVEGT